MTFPHFSCPKRHCLLSPFTASEHQHCSFCICRYFSLVASPPLICRSDLLTSSTFLASFASPGLICIRRSVTSLCMVVANWNGLLSGFFNSKGTIQSPSGMLYNQQHRIIVLYPFLYPFTTLNYIVSCSSIIQPKLSKQSQINIDVAIFVNLNLVHNLSELLICHFTH